MKKCKIVPFVHVLLKFSNISFTVILKSEYRVIDLLKTKLKIKSRATANPDFQERCIFGGFRSRRIFYVGEQLGKKKL